MKNIKFFLKILATLLLLSLIYFKIDTSEVIQVLEKSNFFLISLSFFIIPLLYSIRVIKWDLLLRSFDIKYNFFTLFRIVLIGMFYGMVTPGHFGEVARVYHIDKEKSITIPTIIWDKVIDIFVLFIFTLLSVAFIFYNDNLYIIVFLLILFFIIAIAIFVNRKIINLLLGLTGFDNNSIIKFIDTIHVIKNDSFLLIKLFTLSICYYLLALIMAIISLRALSSEINLYAAFILPIMVLVGNIPITISGFGLREYVTIICFEFIGENTAIGFSFSILLYILITFIPGSIGYIFVIREGNKNNHGKK